MKRANEALVGLSVLVALALVVAGSVWLSQVPFGRTEVARSARFRAIGGLQPGNPVLLRGVRVGRVELIELGQDNWVNVQLRISSRYDLPSRPAAIVSSTTLFGDWAVGLVSADSADLPDDPEVRRAIAEAQRAGADRWPGAALPDIGQLTAQAGRIAGDLAVISSRVQDAFDSTSAQRLRSAFLDLSNLSRRMSQIVYTQQEALSRIGGNLDSGTASLARGAGSLERTLRRADSATNRDQLLRILSHTDTITTELRDVARNLRGVSNAAASQQAALARIIANTDTVLARLAAGQGTLGKLTTDTVLYTESVQAIRDLRRILQDVQANPRRYFSFSVF